MSYEDEKYHARMLAHEQELERRASGIPQPQPAPATPTAPKPTAQKNPNAAKRVGWFLFRSCFFSFVGFAVSMWIFSVMCRTLMPNLRYYPWFNGATVVVWILLWGWLWFRAHRR